jgi:nucleoside-diphosphate-sugar epimerase
MPMHVVVTGAGGFIGGYVAAYLAERGFAVTAIARKIQVDGSPIGGLSWRSTDLCAPDALPSRFDALVHCAAELPSRTSDPERLYRLNADMARNVFAQARAAGAGAVVFLSSMSVYGRISVPVVDEELLPESPDPYGRAKWDAETMLADAVGTGLPSGLSLRLPGTVGFGSHHNFLSDVMGRVLKGQTVTASNPDAPFNNIVCVAHLAAFLDGWLKNPRPGYAVANLAAAEPLPIREVISLLFARVGRPERVEYRSGGKQPFIIALARAQSLGYRPATVRKSIEAFGDTCVPKADIFGETNDV